MVAPSPVVKKVAKDALGRQIIKSMVVCCVEIFVFFINMFISSLVSVFAGDEGYVISLTLLTIFVLGPLFLGILGYFRRLIFEQNDSVLIIFRYFSSVGEYSRAMHLVILLTIRFISAALVLFLPCILIYILSSEKLYEFLGVSLPLWASNLWAVNSLFSVIATVGVMFVMLRYYLAPFMFVSNDNMDPAEDYQGLAVERNPYLYIEQFLFE